MVLSTFTHILWTQTHLCVTYGATSHKDILTKTCSWVYFKTIVHMHMCICNRVSPSPRNHGALHTGPWDPNPVRIRDSNPKRVTLPPHNLDLDWGACCAAWQCSGTVCKIKASSAMHIVSVPYGAHVRSQWIRIREPGFSASVESPNAVLFAETPYKKLPSGCLKCIQYHLLNLW